MNRPQITKANLLDELCYVRFGGSLPNFRTAMKQELTEYLVRSGGGISPQAIHYWFEKDSLPTRYQALDFLRRYVSSEIDVEPLSDDQRVVYGRLREFLSKTVGDVPSTTDDNQRAAAADKVSITRLGKLVIDFGGANLHRTADDLLGTYVTYRVGLTPGPRKPISREVLRVFRKGREHRFEHWYIRSGSELTRFEGVVLGLEGVLWLVGATRRPPERLRIISLRRSGATHTVDGILYWHGIMHSSIPAPDEEPAACRILLRRVQDPSDPTQYAVDTVTFWDENDLPEEERSIILSCANNEVGSLQSAKAEAGAWDTGKLILKVDRTALRDEVRSDTHRDLPPRWY